MNRPVHIAGFAQLPHVPVDASRDEAEMVREVTAMALEQAGLSRDDVGFTCSGSCDYTMGRPFSFATAIDGLGAWPPIRESHVELDGAWALYEAWVRLQHGDIDVALAYAYGKSSVGSMDDVRTAQLDPYSLAPLGLPPIALAALQARALIDAHLATEQDFADVVLSAHAAAARSDHVPTPSPMDRRALLDAPYVAEPLRAHDAATPTDGAAAIVLSIAPRGPRITGIAHAIDPHQPGARPLTDVPSARIAAAAAGLGGGIEVAELHARYASQVGLLSRVLGLGGATINPSGGVLAADTPWVSGLVRIGEAARAVRLGASRALAHASGGPLLQHNLICLLEAP